MHPSPSHWEDQLLYFLLPDRFSSGNETGYVDNNGNLVTGPGTPPFNPSLDANNALHSPSSTKEWLDAGRHFCGGTLKGATSKLGYLKRMGITTLWLGPVFKQVASSSTSYHGYAIQNFLEVEPRFGTREDLRELVKEAHRLGMYVLLDVVLNHAGDVFAYDHEGKGWADYEKGRRYDAKGWFDKERRATIPMCEESIDENAHPGAYPDGAIWPRELQSKNCFERKGQIKNWDEAPEYMEGDFHSLKSFDLGASQDPSLATCSSSIAKPAATSSKSPSLQRSTSTGSKKTAKRKVGGKGEASFVPTTALKVLTTVHKYWLAYADIDGFRLDTVKHMGVLPTAYFVSQIRSFARSRGKSNFFVVGEIVGPQEFVLEMVERTGLDAALGVGVTMERMVRVLKGGMPIEGFVDMFEKAGSTGGGQEISSKGEKDKWRKWTNGNVVTMLDDHDQVWRGLGPKSRLCFDSPPPPQALLSPKTLSSLVHPTTQFIPCSSQLPTSHSPRTPNPHPLLPAALAFNLLTPGLPCTYYGTEHSFSGSSSAASLLPGFDPSRHYDDQFLRECMHGGGFGTFGSRGGHFFSEEGMGHKVHVELARVRREIGVLRKGAMVVNEVVVQTRTDDSRGVMKDGAKVGTTMGKGAVGTRDAKTLGYTDAADEARLCFSTTTLTNPHTPTGTGIIAWSRTLPNEEVLIVMNVNLSTEFMDVRILLDEVEDEKSYFEPDEVGRMECLYMWDGETVRDRESDKAAVAKMEVKDGRWSLRFGFIPRGGVRVWRVR